MIGTRGNRFVVSVERKSVLSRENRVLLASFSLLAVLGVAIDVTGIGWGLASSAKPPESSIVSALVLGLIGALVVSGFVAGYRASIR